MKERKVCCLYILFEFCNITNEPEVFIYPRKDNIKEPNPRAVFIWFKES
jgi:hypothetical protein